MYGRQLCHSCDFWSGSQLLYCSVPPVAHWILPNLRDDLHSGVGGCFWIRTREIDMDVPVPDVRTSWHMHRFCHRFSVEPARNLGVGILYPRHSLPARYCGHNGHRHEVLRHRFSHRLQEAVPKEDTRAIGSPRELSLRERGRARTKPT